MPLPTTRDEVGVYVPVPNKRQTSDKAAQGHVTLLFYCSIMTANPTTLLVQGPTHKHGQLTIPPPPQVVEAIRLNSQATKIRGEPSITCFLHALLICSTEQSHLPNDPQHVNDAAMASCAQYEAAVIDSSMGDAVARMLISS